MNKAYSVLEIKSFDDDKRTFTGIASTPSTDRQGDIVEPKGAVYKLPIPLLWQHRSSEPVGEITSAKVTANGIEVSGKFAQIDEPPSLKDDLDRAWAMVKNKLVRGLSIGFSPIEFAQIKESFGLRYTKWEWLELSAVTIPANQEASIQTIKSIDQAQQRSASGAAPPTTDRPPPGATGTSNRPRAGFFTSEAKGKGMKTIQEQITGYEATRQAKAARKTELMSKAAEEGATLDKEQSDEYDGLDLEVKEIDKHLARLHNEFESNLAQAKAVDGSTSGATPETVQKSQASPGRITMDKPKVAKGAGFTRLAIALAFAKGNLETAANIAKRWKDTSPEVSNILQFGAQSGGSDFAAQIMAAGGLESIQKTAIAAGTTTDATWASPLVQYSNLASEFVELLYPETILGRLQGLRRVPFNIRFPSQTAGASVGWVGQGAAKPVSKLAFATTTMSFAKAAGIVVITQELARFSSPSAEQVVQTDLVNTMAQFLDQQFIGPGVAAVANVSPASITNGITPTQSTGNTRALIDVDVQGVMSGLLSNNIPLSSLVWVMTPYSALKLSMVRESTGEQSYPGISLNGGTFQGIPVITSNNVPNSVSAGSIIVLVATNEIFLADDGGVQLDASDQASLQMDSAPTNNGATPTATSLVSLWQDNLIGIRAERIINWQRRRDTAVAYIDNVHL